MSITQRFKKLLYVLSVPIIWVSLLQGGANGQFATIMYDGLVIVVPIHNNTTAPTIDTPIDAYTKTPTITGTCTAGTTITLKVDGTTVSPTATCDENGKFAITITTPELSDGTHSITVMQTDAHGDTISSETPVTVTTHTFTQTKFTLFAWGELGMHCMDEGYDTFSLLPPYNTLKAQLLVKGESPRIVNEGVTITYEALAKSDGSINTTSSSKSNFWQYADKLFPGVTLQNDVGLAGKNTQSTTPHTMDYNGTYNLYVAEGIPTVPVNDAGYEDEYPLVKVVAKNSNGQVLAETVTTLAVSSEMSCAKCHANNPTVRMDVLKKHDNHFPHAVDNNNAALQSKGYNYNQSGLAATANSGTPVLCVACHSSNIIPDSGITGIKPLTEAIHHAHASRTLPGENVTLNDSRNRSACYACHPGESTKCLRGAMGHAVDQNGNSLIQCQSCHGTMEAVATSSRQGWIDEPNCQACHQEGNRFTAAVTDMNTGTLRSALDLRFGTEKETDSNNTKLYKHSLGHGGVACSACHGSQHAIYPSTVADENRQSIDHQGYEGTIRECGVCHADKVSLTTFSSGPHGLHPHNQHWVDTHGTVVLRHTTDNCKACHGNDQNGTSLSKASASRTFKLGVTNRYVHIDAGEVVGCTTCHESMN